MRGSHHLEECRIARHAALPACLLAALACAPVAHARPPAVLRLSHVPLAVAPRQRVDLVARVRGARRVVFVVRRVHGRHVVRLGAARVARRRAHLRRRWPSMRRGAVVVRACVQQRPRARLRGCRRAPHRTRVLTHRRRHRPAPPSGPPEPVPPPGGAAPPRYPCSNGTGNAPAFPVTPGPPGSRGRVLPGRALRSNVWTGEPAPELVQDPDAPHYPGGRYPAGDPAWNRLDVPPTGTVVHATSATATFNGEDAAYRTAFHLSHFGGMPADAGDFNGDGIDDLLVTEHFGWVDGMQYAGEVDLYYGRRAGIDPRREVPDVVFYGDEAGAKLGLSVAGVGDVNGDGWDDIAMSAGFHSERDEAGHTLPNAGEIYLVFGGYLQAFGCTVKVRTTDIGVRVPGIVFAGGHDGRRYVGWANDLDAGDFNGDGVQDLLIGAADPYPGDSPTFAARGYLVYGGHGLPLRYRGYRLGVDRDVGGIRSAVYEAPDGEVTRASLGFQATFVGDVNGDGRDDIAFATGRGGSGDGAVALFLGEPGPPPGAVVPLADAQTTIVADSSAALRFRRLEGARPAGDVDGDGHQDVLLQARATQQYVNGTWTRVGASVLLRGADALPHSVGLSQLGPVFVGRPGDAIGQPAVDMPADIDGDGFSDLLLNDPYFHEPVGGEQQMRGRLWLVRGGPHLPDVVDVEAQAARTFVADTRVPGMFGFTWTTGDWNGDGRPDIVIGDHYAGDHALHVHAGRAYVLTNGVSFSW